MALKFVQTGYSGGSGSGSGTYDHNLLVNRGMPDQHTIESVTGLRTALDKKYEKPFSGIPKTDLAFNVATTHDIDVFRNTELADVINDLSALALEVGTARGGLDTLKAYIDTIMSAGKTFKYTPEGPEGLMKGKKAIHIHGMGGFYSQAIGMEHSDSYVKGALKFVGVEVVPTIFVEGIDYDPTKEEKIVATTTEKAKAVARTF
jgi:hypothetical protein